MNLKLLCIILLLTFSSCSLQKRLYTKGFYTSKPQTKKVENIRDSLPIISILPKKSISSNLVAFNSSRLIPHSKLVLGCDTIILKNGSKLIGTITEIKTNKIYFKNCDSASYSSSAINKKDVNSINFANGKKGINEFKKDELKKPKKSAHDFFAVFGGIFIGLSVLLVCLLYLGIAKNIGTGLLIILIAIISFFLGLLLLLISLLGNPNKEV